MMKYSITRTSPDELKHFGIPGQKRGVRKYQNEDGSLTPEGREHYGYGDDDSDSRRKRANKVYEQTKNESMGSDRTMKLMSKGFKVLDAIATYNSLKDAWG